MRRSPGGSTPNSPRNRPEEPPSSATVTTAVRSSETWRSAWRDAKSPWPPPSATMEGPRVPPVLPRPKVRLVMAFPGRSVHMTHKYRMPGHDVFRNVLEISEDVTCLIPGTCAISSTSAARIFLTDPKCLSSAFRRVGPRPDISSSAEAIIDFARFLRWNLLATRLDSLCHRRFMYGASYVHGCMTGRPTQ